jgi:hypothetical protein
MEKIITLQINSDETAELQKIISERKSLKINNNGRRHVSTVTSNAEWIRGAIPKLKILNTRTCLLLGSNFFVSLHTINEDISEGSIHIELCKRDFWVNG